MSAALDQLKSTLAELAEPERAELAEYLLRSLDGEPKSLQDWSRIAAERMADVKAGKVQGIPAEEVLRNLPGSRR